MILRYRNNQFNIEFKSIDQSHAFNTPFQVGTRGDNPEVAISNSHEINDQDVLIVASDGYKFKFNIYNSLWDNLENDQIISIVNKNSTGGQINSIEYLAEKLTFEAEKYSLDKTYLSPFAKKKNINQNTSSKNIGGKQDDITVVVAQIEMKLNINIVNSSVVNTKPKVNSKYSQTKL